MLVIEKRHGQDGKDYADFRMVYPSDSQLINLTIMDLDNPPMSVPLVIKGLNRNEDGLYSWHEFISYIAAACQ